MRSSRRTSRSASRSSAAFARAPTAAAGSQLCAKTAFTTSSRWSGSSWTGLRLPYSVGRPIRSLEVHVELTRAEQVSHAEHHLGAVERLGQKLVRPQDQRAVS